MQILFSLAPSRLHLLMHSRCIYGATLTCMALWLVLEVQENQDTISALQKYIVWQVRHIHKQVSPKRGENVLQKQKGEGERREKITKRYLHCDVSSPGGEEREGRAFQTIVLLIQGEVSDESGKPDVGQIVSGLVYATKELRLFAIRQKKADSWQGNQTSAL